MWKYSKSISKLCVYSVSDNDIKHNSVFGIHFKRDEKMKFGDTYKLTVNTGQPCIGFCNESYEPESFVYSTSFEKSIEGISYLHLSQHKRAFADMTLTESVCDLKFHHYYEYKYPYDIYIRICKESHIPQFRYDDKWHNFGNFVFKEQDYYPYLYLTCEDEISNFMIVREKPTKSAQFVK
tara:strand:+ start:11118 stop:11657 length:540 start_codon:yes stop_codon:yes gene_type:complete